MSATPRSQQDRPQRLAERRADAVCLRFEEAWKSGQRPRIAEYLERVTGSERAVLLRELLALELTHRRQRGEEPTPEEYRRQFRGDGKLIDAIFRALLPSLSQTSLINKPERGSHAAIRAIVEVVDGPHRGVRYEFDRHATLVAGRAKTAQLCLAKDPYFSRHHFLLEFNPPRCYLRDLGSRNGTLLNGQSVKEAFLKDGDFISGGRTRLRFAVMSEAEPAVEAALVCLVCGKQVPAAIAPHEPGFARGPACVCPSCREEIRKHPQPVPGYELVREIGRGGMGVVYLARQTATGQPVALKLLVPESAASDRAVQMFLREVSVLSQLNHPRIVRFHEAGMAKGQFFLAMEYVETIDLNELLARQTSRNSIKTVCGLFCQALEGLGHAHDRSFVHRDVKPSNLLVTRTGRKLSVKLTDFGLAKNFENAGFSGLTRTGEVRGSLPFMAPEQILDCRTAKPGADLYSAGASLYFLLAQSPPHDFPPGRDPYAIILDDDIVPLSQRCPTVPPGLVTAVHRGLAREPAKRFASAAEMRLALLPYAKGTAPDQ